MGAVEGAIASAEGMIADIIGTETMITTIANYALATYAFTQVVTHLQTFGEGVIDFTEGSANEFVGFFEGGGIALKDIIHFIITSVKYFSELVMCTTRSLQNFPSCFVWYVIQIFGIIMYLPIKFLFWMTGLGKYEDMIWDALYELDKKFYNATGGHKNKDECSGYHFLHYPCWIINKCYRCRNDEGKQMADKEKYISENKQFIDDLSEKGRLKKLLINPLIQMATGLSKMFSVFLPE
jgi:hypothetical protein